MSNKLPDPQGSREAPPANPSIEIALYRAQCFIRELVALHRVRGPLTPTAETVCREADAFVAGVPGSRFGDVEGTYADTRNCYQLEQVVPALQSPDGDSGGTVGNVSDCDVPSVRVRPSDSGHRLPLYPTLFTGHPDGIYREISINVVRGWFEPVAASVATPADAMRLWHVQKHAEQSVAIGRTLNHADWLYLRTQGERSAATAIFRRLEHEYDFACTGGPLGHCVDWHALKALLHPPTVVTAPDESTIARLRNALSDCLEVIEPVRDELRKQGKDDAATACDEVVAYARSVMRAASVAMPTPPVCKTCADVGFVSTTEYDGVLPYQSGSVCPDCTKPAASVATEAPQRQETTDDELTRGETRCSPLVSSPPQPPAGDK